MTAGVSESVKLGVPFLMFLKPRRKGAEMPAGVA